jgi:uncharacterized membrane protein YtjA (UPF0391 family)
VLPLLPRSPPSRGTSAAALEWRGDGMLFYALVFFLIALIAGFLGFFGIASDAAWVAKALFVVFLVAAVVTLLAGRRRIV